MHHVSELVEESHHVVVVQERWFVCCRLVKVADHSGGRRSDTSTQITPLNHREHSRMVVLVLTWEQIKIEVPQKLLSRRILYLISLHILVPNLHPFKLLETQTKKLLIDLHSLRCHVYHLEVLLDLVLVYLVESLFLEVLIKHTIPAVNLGTCIFGFLLLELAQVLILSAAFLHDLLDQVLFKLLNGSWLLSHANLQDELGVRLVAEQFG